MDIKTYASEFITYLEIERNVSKYTIKAYSSDIKQFLEFLKSNKSIERKLATIRSFFKFLVREGYQKTNPTLAVSSPKTDKKLPEFLTVENMIFLRKS